MIDPKTVAALDGLLDDLADRVAMRVMQRIEAVKKVGPRPVPVLPTPPTMPVEPKGNGKSALLTKKQAAKILNVHEKTIDRYRAEQGLKWVKLYEGTVRFRMEDLEEYVESHTRQWDISDETPVREVKPKLPLAP